MTATSTSLRVAEGFGSLLMTLVSGCLNILQKNVVQHLQIPKDSTVQQHLRWRPVFQKQLVVWHLATVPRTRNKILAITVWITLNRFCFFQFSWQMTTVEKNNKKCCPCGLMSCISRPNAHRLCPKPKAPQHIWGVPHWTSKGLWYIHCGTTDAIDSQSCQGTKIWTKPSSAMASKPNPSISLVSRNVTTQNKLSPRYNWHDSNAKSTNDKHVQTY